LGVGKSTAWGTISRFDIEEIMPSIDLLLAYFDPGSGSLLVQALVGGTAGLLVFAKYLWDSAPAFFRARKQRDARVD
jgi:hypothetical protein